MNKAKGTASEKDYEMSLPNRKDSDKLRKRFGELYVLYALRDNLKTAIEEATQNN